MRGSDLEEWLGKSGIAKHGLAVVCTEGYVNGMACWVTDRRKAMLVAQIETVILTIHATEDENWDANLAIGKRPAQRPTTRGRHGGRPVRGSEGVVTGSDAGACER